MNLLKKNKKKRYVVNRFDLDVFIFLVVLSELALQAEVHKERKWVKLG